VPSACPNEQQVVVANGQRQSFEAPSRSSCRPPASWDRAELSFASSMSLADDIQQRKTFGLVTGP
jgi:hypothetical protein